MTRIREINAGSLARQGFFVDDYSKERVEKLEDDFVAGFEVDEKPNTLRLQPAADGLGIDLPTAPSVKQARRPPSNRDLAAPSYASEAAGAPDPFADPDTDWSFGDK